MFSGEITLLFRVFIIMLFFPLTHAALGVILLLFAFSQPSSSETGSSMKLRIDGVMDAAASGNPRGLAAIGGLLLIMLSILEVVFR
ncbi:MAG TPA: hypothetical protein VEX11_03640 [Acetobacteraceae bacterium]|nr:hypothetical protein [Acetobacteraceae bacterium]